MFVRCTEPNKRRQLDEIRNVSSQHCVGNDDSVVLLDKSYLCDGNRRKRQMKSTVRPRLTLCRVSKEKFDLAKMMREINGVAVVWFDARIHH